MEQLKNKGLWARHLVWFHGQEEDSMAKTNHSRRGGSCGGSCSPVFRSRRSVCVWGSVCAVVWHGYFRVNINYVCCMPAAIHESTRRKVCYIEVAPCVCVCVCAWEPASVWANFLLARQETGCCYRYNST